MYKNYSIKDIPSLIISLGAFALIFFVCKEMACVFKGLPLNKTDRGLVLLSTFIIFLGGNFAYFYYSFMNIDKDLAIQIEKQKLELREKKVPKHKRKRKKQIKQKK